MSARLAFGGLAIVAALVIGACEPTAAPQRCRRYEGVALVPENHFAASLELDATILIDLPEERLDVAMSVVPPVRGTIDLVHVVGDREMERWELTVPDPNPSIVRCLISPAGGWLGCGAVIREVPHPTGGYYYMRPNGNTVLEAGLSFYLCD